MPFNIDPEKQCPELISVLPKIHNILISSKENRYIKGFLIEKCPLWQRLERAFEKYFLEEVLFAAKRYVRETTETEGLLKNRILYLNVFKEGLENATVFDSGREFLKIYLLAHLKQYKNLLPEVPKILSSVVPDFPPKKAEELKLKLFYGLWQEISNLLSKKESKAYNLWQEIFNAPQFFLESTLKLPEEFPWAFGEAYYEIPSEKIKRYFSDAIIQGKDFLNSREGKKIILNFFKREISIEEALCSEEILNLLPISDETLNFMKKLSLNLRYGEIFKSYLENIHFCVKNDENYFLNEIKLDEETKPLKFGLPGIINPVVSRYLFLIQIKDLNKNFDNMVLMDTKSYGEFLKEKEEFEIFSLREAKTNNIFFEKYIKNGALFSSRSPKNLFDFSLKVFLDLINKKSQLIKFNLLRGHLGKGSFYLLPYFFPNDETRYEIIGHHIDENLNFLESCEFDQPFLLLSYNFLENLFQNLEIKNLEIFKTDKGNSLKISYKEFTFLLFPFINEMAILKPKKDGEVVKSLEPNFSLLKITELIENLRNL